MTSYLMMAVGLLICLCGIVVASLKAGRAPYRGELPKRSRLFVVVFLVLFAVDLALQTFQLNGARQPLPIALADAAVTSAIFCALSLYAGALAGRTALSKAVAILAVALFVFASLRSLISSGAFPEVARSVAIALKVAWLITAFVLATIVAFTAGRNFKTQSPLQRARSERTDVAWPTMLLAILWSTALLMVARAVFAPMLGGWPTLTAALDSPFIDTLYVSVFVLSGVVTGGLRRAREPAVETEADDASIERWDRILQKADHALDRHFADPELSMPRLAALIGCSEHRLSAALNRRRGMSFSAYVNGRRIQAAMELIRGGETTIGNVAYQCGYNARSTFYVAFKTAAGESVQDWKKRVAGSGEVSGSADSDTSARVSP